MRVETFPAFRSKGRCNGSEHVKEIAKCNRREHGVVRTIDRKVHDGIGELDQIRDGGVESLSLRVCLRDRRDGLLKSCPKSGFQSRELQFIQRGF